MIILKKLLFGILLGLLLSFSQFQNPVFAGGSIISEEQQLKAKQLWGTVYKYQYIVPAARTCPAKVTQVYRIACFAWAESRAALEFQTSWFQHQSLEEKTKTGSGYRVCFPLWQHQHCHKWNKDLPLKVVLNQKCSVKKTSYLSYPEKKQK